MNRLSENKRACNSGVILPISGETKEDRYYRITDEIAYYEILHRGARYPCA